MESDELANAVTAMQVTIITSARAKVNTDLNDFFIGLSFLNYGPFLTSKISALGSCLWMFYFCRGITSNYDKFMEGVPNQLVRLVGTPKPLVTSGKCTTRKIHL